MYSFLTRSETQRIFAALGREKELLLMEQLPLKYPFQVTFYNFLKSNDFDVHSTTFDAQLLSN